MLQWYETFLCVLSSSLHTCFFLTWKHNFPPNGNVCFNGWRSGTCGQGGNRSLECVFVVVLSVPENLLTPLTNINGVRVRKILVSALDLFLSCGSLCRETCSKITCLSLLH